MRNDETQAVALGYASMFLIAAWRAAQTSETGAMVGPDEMAEFERQVEAGEIALSVHVQRRGDDVRVLVAASAPEWQDPFAGGALLDLTGPLVVSAEQLARLVPKPPSQMN